MWVNGRQGEHVHKHMDLYPIWPVLFVLNKFSQEKMNILHCDLYTFAGDFHATSCFYYDLTRRYGASEIFKVSSFYDVLYFMLSKQDLGILGLSPGDLYISFDASLMLYLCFTSCYYTL